MAFFWKLEETLLGKLYNLLETKICITFSLRPVSSILEKKITLFEHSFLEAVYAMSFTSSPMVQKRGMNWALEMTKKNRVPLKGTTAGTSTCLIIELTPLEG